YLYLCPLHLLSFPTRRSSDLTLLSVLGILSQFEGFLTILGVALPPVGAIMSVEYFLIKRYKPMLDATRSEGILPESYESWNPVRSEEHTSELQSRFDLVCRLL